MKSWTITLEEDPETGDLLLPFTDEILTEVGWKIGDTLVWEEKDDTWIIRRKDGTPEVPTE